MKSRLLPCIVVALLVAGCSKSGKDSLNLTGSIQGLPDGTVIELIPVSHFPEKPVASLTVENGQFQWSDTIDEPMAVRMALTNGYLIGQNLMILENGALNITGVALPDSAREGVYQLGEIAYEGSALTDKYHNLMSVRDTLNDLYSEYMTRNQPILDQLSAARSTGDQAVVAAVQDSEAYKTLEADEKAFFDTVQQKYSDVILSNKDTFFGPLMMITLMNYLRPEDKETYDQFSPAAKESLYGRMVKAEVDPETAVGKEAPGFALPNAKGEEVDFLTVCANNKLTILDFWASWCAPCRRSMPGLKELYKEYHDKGLEIVGVSIDKEEDAWLKALEQLELPWINVRDIADDASGLYKVKAVPTLYVIDQQGVIVATDLHGEELTNYVSEQLN